MVLGRRTILVHPPTIKKGGICIAGHGGGWDLALLAVATAYPVTIFLKRPTGTIAKRFIEYYRTKHDIEPLYGRGTMPQAYEALQRGRLVIFIQDQRLNDGIHTTFFGKACKTSAAFAVMAWRTKAPLYGIWQWKSNSEHHCQIEPLDWEIPQDLQTATHELTQKTQDFYEKKIKANPYSWLWLHRRWK